MQNFDIARRRFLLALFVISGFTGLIYESIWAQYLRLFLGHAAYAQTVVLAMFMGGMALGSWLVSRYCTRLRQLLWSYLLVEAVIGIFGVLFHRMFVAATDFSFATVIPTLSSAAAIHAYKWSLAALLVFPQSVLLGMTFPLISIGIIRRWPERAGETLSALYFTNSLGGAIGVLVGGFILIGRVGLPGTTLTAGLLNVALAFGVWLVVRRHPEPPPVPEIAPVAGTASCVTDRAAKWFVTAAFLTGAASFMYELGWIRMLSLVLGSSTHSFELMLSAFIFGLAFGGLYVRKRIDRIASAESYLGGIMLTMGVLAALTLPASNLMFEFMARSIQAFTRTDEGYVAFNAVSQSIALLIMLPATLCAGMTLPVLTHALMRRGAGEKAIGTIYSANTLGAIVGVLLTVHMLMPLIGVRGVILTGACIHIALGLSRLVPRGIRQPATASAMALSIAVLGVVAVRGQIDPARIAASVYRTGIARLPEDVKVTYLRDGKTATITLTEQRGGRVTIATNGKPDASIQMTPGEATPDEVTMVLAAAIPLSLHPNAARVANIGFGSGLTSHTLLASPRLERLDTIEIEPMMVEAARRGFGPRIHDVFEDRRSHIVYDDAKTFFAASREPYDLIVSEPSNPWVSGVATLFSDEFYGGIVRHLRPDGYFAQWLQIYETDISVVGSIMKALSRHFAAYQIYNMDDSNILIVATRSATLPTLSDDVFSWTEMRTELDRIGAQSVAHLESRLIGDDRIMNPLFSTLGVPANSDFFPFVDLNAPRLFFEGKTAKELPGLTLLPLPFLEVLRGDSVRGLTTEPSSKSRLVRDQQVRRAMAIRRALSGGRLDGLDDTAEVALLLIRASGNECAQPRVQETWGTAVRSVSNMTAPYLSPSELADIWSYIKSTPCYREGSGETKAWTDVLAAISARNFSEIVMLGSRLLEPPSSLSKDDLSYLTTAMATGYIRLGETSQARNLLMAHLGSLDWEGPSSLPLRGLLALARKGAGPGLAGGREQGSEPRLKGP
jgi:spermidine synthase